VCLFRRRAPDGPGRRVECLARQCKIGVTSAAGVLRRRSVRIVRGIRPSEVRCSTVDGTFPLAGSTRVPGVPGERASRLATGSKISTARGESPPTRICRVARSTSSHCNAMTSCGLNPLRSSTDARRTSGVAAANKPLISSAPSSRAGRCWSQQSARAGFERGHGVPGECGPFGELTTRRWIRHGLRHKQRRLRIGAVEDLHDPHNQQREEERADHADRRIPR
jgi:hypothetical protein